jgi:hypothetical protein
VAPFLFGKFLFPSGFECVTSASQAFKSAMFFKVVWKQKVIGGRILQRHNLETKCIENLSVGSVVMDRTCTYSRHGDLMNLLFSKGKQAEYDSSAHRFERTWLLRIVFNNSGILIFWSLVAEDNFYCGPSVEGISFFQ